jgi:UDP-glucose 4-epimerase
VKEIVRSSSEIRYVPYDQAYEEGFEDMPRRVPSIERISKLIGWRPVTSLDTTIEDIARYYKESGRQLSRPVAQRPAEAVA